MKWIGRRQSDNVEDQRGAGGGGMIGGGGFKLGGLGIAAVVVISLLLGKNPMQMLQMVGGAQNGLSSATEQSARINTKEDDELAGFVKVVLADTEDVWTKLFEEKGSRYQMPHLVIFRDQTQSGCGGASSSMGPFYCSADEKVYIDLAFYQEMRDKLNAPGDFAMAYVIAHEVGHHVQHLMGISDKIHRMQQGMSEEEANKLSVRLELQADFFAGVWAHHAQKMKNILETGDLEEALNAASAVGDDHLQMQAQGRIMPDAFTHGTSAQRMYWFKKGMETGDISQGDTFNNREI